MQKAIDKERKHCLERLKVYGALRLLSLNMGRKNHEWQLRQVQLISQYSRGKIRSATKNIDYLISELKKHLGAEISDNKLLKLPILQEMEQYQAEEYQGEIDFLSKQRKIWCVPKNDYLKIFSKLENIAVGYYIAPRHAYLQTTYAPHDGLKNYLGFVTPETSLFESMAAQFNYLSRITEEYKTSSNKAHVKEIVAARRSCIFLSLGFVEAFINGVSEITVYERARSLLKKDLALLMEVRESDASKVKFVSFRDKLLQYPRIAATLDFPPFTESNCKEFGIIVEKGKEYRDAIAHPNSMGLIKLEKSIPSLVVNPKFINLIDCSFDDVVSTVDAAISLVLKIDKITHNWIHQFITPRNDQGVFPDEVFD